MYKNGERMMAWVAKIEEITSISGADQIVAYRIGGWCVVDKKNAYNVGDLVVYISIDSWIPTELAPFLSKGKEPREYNGVKGERLRTVKLRGQVSQGLLLPLTYLGAIEGDDVTESLGIQKYEPPISAQLAGVCRSTFPSFIRKTDQERAQNLGKDIFGRFANERFEVTLKLDGSSCTIYYNDGDVGVCSRNMDLVISDENAGNSFVRAARLSGLLDLLKNHGDSYGNIAIQCELMGPGIQGNKEGFDDVKLFVFDIFDIDKQSYLSPADRMQLFNVMKNLGLTDCIEHVPVIGHYTPAEIGNTVGDLLAFADGTSINAKVREGLVWKNVNEDFSFKTISNKFLLSGGDE